MQYDGCEQEIISLEEANLCRYKPVNCFDIGYYRQFFPTFRAVDKRSSI